MHISSTRPYRTVAWYVGLESCPNSSAVPISAYHRWNRCVGGRASVAVYVQNPRASMLRSGPGDTADRAPAASRGISMPFVPMSKANNYRPIPLLHCRPRRLRDPFTPTCPARPSTLHHKRLALPVADRCESVGESDVELTGTQAHYPERGQHHSQPGLSHDLAEHELVCHQFY